MPENQRLWDKDEVRDYCLGLIIEECGEVVETIGKGLRFGHMTPRSVGRPMTNLDALHNELGDLWAAIDFGVLHGIFDGPRLLEAKQRKLNKLFQNNRTDHLGRQFAPPLEDR